MFDGYRYQECLVAPIIGFRYDKQEARLRAPGRRVARRIDCDTLARPEGIAQGLSRAAVADLDASFRSADGPAGGGVIPARPDGSRSPHLLSAMLAYVITTICSGLQRSWVGKVMLPPTLGLWWVHGLVPPAIGVLWLSSSGNRWRLDRYKRVAL
jgi:hypothetical protein